MRLACLPKMEGMHSEFIQMRAHYSVRPPFYAHMILILTNEIVFSVTFSQDAADYERFQALADKIMSDIASLAKERGLYHPFIYQNYAGSEQDVYAGYSKENRARLRQIQRKYDPEGVFWKLQPGYHKV